MVPFAQHALAAIELCGRRSGACKQWWRRVGKADDGGEQTKGAVGVAMQFLVMIDKLHDMHQRQVVSDSDFAQWSNWAREHVTS